jgi:Na+(H+)/acetate symporter ActP
VISLTSSFSVAASKSPEMGVAAMAISFIVVPVVSLLTKNKKEDQERVEEIFSCYKEN